VSERSSVGVGGTQLASKLSLLSEETRREIDHWVAKFPPGRQRSASIAALRAAQEQNSGFLTADLMDAVAEYLKLPPIQVCEELLAFAQEKLGIRANQSTPDGRIFLKREEECLAACTGAPMMMVDHVFHEHLTAEKLAAILDALK